jgi:hypothetical protein
LQDGVVSYILTFTDGDTYLKRAKLVAEATPRTVPEGGAPLPLLVMGMFVLIASSKLRRLAVS